MYGPCSYPTVAGVDRLVFNYYYYYSKLQQKNRNKNINNLEAVSHLIDYVRIIIEIITPTIIIIIFPN
jgi:hypothetical protein